MVRIRVEIAPGELFDRLSILEIKADRISDPGKLSHIRAERESLAASRDRDIVMSDGLGALCAELKEINEALWDIEDRLRVLERERDFGDEFVQLARSVYITNDRRAAAKNRINRMLNSDIGDAKSYEAY